MLQIDIDADLNWVDDEDRNIAKVPNAASLHKTGDVAVAGRPGFWSWALIEEIDGEWVFFRQIDAREAAAHGGVVAAATA
jgi:hypothetical protein